MMNKGKDYDMNSSNYITQRLNYELACNKIKQDKTIELA